ncbi:hypothetical protein D3C76_1116150 [compost metagenome]
MVRDVVKTSALLHYYIITKIIKWHCDCIVLRVYSTANIFPLRIFIKSEHSYCSTRLINNILIKAKFQCTALRRNQFSLWLSQENISEVL